ncbi:MAG: class I SAM-dependent RNA methyltransferase [Nitrospirae bacterium]|nr:MAG: class I SAM-dependent RNA methyltransferase [Nitrospirota bacterium]
MTLETLIPLYGGYSLAKGDGTVFVRGAIPGEVVQAEIVEKKRDYSIADAVEILQRSEDRTSPECPVFGLCGGCHYQYISYPRQVRIKEEILLDCLKRIGKLDLQLDAPLLGNPWYYRRRAQFKVSPQGRIGFYKPLSHQVVEFERCLLLQSEINDLIGQVRSMGIPQGVREIHVISGDTLAVDVRGRAVDRAFLRELLQIRNVSGVYLNGTVVEGEQRVCLMLRDIFYFVSCGSFFQSNWTLNNRLVQMVCDVVENLSPERVLDLYAGGGNFSLAVSGLVKEVVAAEENPSSFEDALFNIRYNEIENVKFKNRKVESLLVKKRVDMVIADPPRTGMTKEALKKTIELLPEWIIYISCNPSTLARDLNRLSSHYQVESVRLVDMFPQTYHIEAVSLLRKRGEE